MFFFPEYHLKGQGLFQKSRSMTALNGLYPMLAQLFLRLFHYSQGTLQGLLGEEEHCVHLLRLCTAQSGGEGIVAHTDHSVCHLHDCRGWPFCRILGIAKDARRQLGNPWLVLLGFL